MVLVHLTSYHESENLPEEPPMDWTLMTVRMMSASIRLVNTEWRRAHDAMLEELAPSRLPDLPHPRKGLSRFPNVKIFNLRLCMYDAGIPEGLFEDVAAVWPHLTKLDARRFCSNDSNGPRFRVQGGPAWRGLSRVPALSRLTSLHLGGGACDVDDAGLGAVARLTALTHLDLKGCLGATEAGLRQVARLPDLRRVSFAWCRRAATDRVMWELPLGLESLDLTGVQGVTDVGVAVLTRLPALTQLDLSRCSLVTNRGVLVLRRLKTLRVLELQGCTRISDEGLRGLAALSGLTSLNVARCSFVTSQGACSILGRVSTLTRLNLS